MQYEDLAELIRDYKYNQFNILNAKFNMTYSVKEEKMIISNLYRHNLRPKEGSCAELMNTAYLNIREKYPDTYVTRVIGNDVNYFDKPYSNHCFLLISDNDLLNGKEYTSQRKDIDWAYFQNPIVVDPSFQMIARLSSSGYRIKTLINQGCKVRYSNTHILNNKQAVPLGIDRRGTLVYIVANFDSKKIITIGRQSPKNAIISHDLFSKELGRELKKDPELCKCIYFLRRKHISIVDHFSNNDESIIIS